MTRTTIAERKRRGRQKLEPKDKNALLTTTTPAVSKQQKKEKKIMPKPTTSKPITVKPVTSSTPAPAIKPTAPATSSKPFESTANLLTIPQELRDLIYDHVLGDGEMVALGPFRRWMEPNGANATKYADAAGNGFLRLHKDNYTEIQSKIVHPRHDWHTPLSPILSSKNLPEEGSRAKAVMKMQGSVFPALPLVIRSNTRPGSKKHGTQKLEHSMPIAKKLRKGKLALTKRAILEAASNRNSRAQTATKRPNNPKFTPMKKSAWSRNTALALTCRQTHQEFTQLMYKKNLFAFGSRRQIADFTFDLHAPLNPTYHIPKHLPVAGANLSLIRFVSLDCRPEGVSTLLSQVYRQQASYDAWAKCCTVMATRMTGLTDLTLFIEAPWSGPYELSLKAIWVKPFLGFAQSKSLERVAVNIAVQAEVRYDVERPALPAFAEIMRRKILGWDHASAVEAVGQYREMYPGMEETWERMVRWNRAVV